MGPVPDPSRPIASRGDDLSPWGWAAVGVGGAGVVAFAVLYALADVQLASLVAACGGSRCPPERASDVDRGRAYEIGAGVSLAIGIAGVVAGAAILVVSLTSGASSTSARLGDARLSAGPGGLSLVW